MVWHRPESREIVQYLADNGAKYDIFTAARAGLLDPVREMLTENHRARSPQLHSQIDLVLKTGGDINAKDGQGWTPLDYAIDRERKEMIQHLRDNGA